MSTFINAYSPTNLRFLFEGLLVTVEVSIISIVLSYIIGLILGTIRYMKIKYVSAIVGVIIDIIRNLPLLLIIFFTYFGFPELGIHASPFWAAISALVIFESQFVSLVKDTSLATIIILPELLYHAQIIYSQNTTYMIPMYLIIAAMYFVVCFALSLFAQRLRKKLGKEA